MKKLSIALLVLALIAAMVTPVVAEDRLSLAGQFRVRGWHYDDGQSGPTESWADQRFRLGGKLAVAEGVSITFRTDITESNWGTGNTFGSGRIGVQQWDRAHIDLQKGNFHWRLGQQYIALGKTYAVDSQSNGVTLNWKGAVKGRVFVLLYDDNGGKTANDAFLSGIAIAPKLGAADLNIFLANQNDGREENVYLFGVDASFGIGKAKVGLELDYFSGDADETANIDAYGTQLMIDVSGAVSDTFTLGGQLFYAMGSDKANEVQYVNLGNGFGGWDPLNNVGTKLHNEQLTVDRPFDAIDPNAGIQALRLYGQLKAGAKTGVGASITYAQPQEDSVAVTDVDSAMLFALGVTHAVMDNTSIDFQLQVADVDAPGAKTETGAGLGVFVSF